MKKNICLIVLLILCSGIYFVSCSSRRIKKDMTLNKETDEKIYEGKLVFKSQCQKCHPNGEAGVGPALNNIKLPAFLIKFRVRSRAMLLWAVRMPSFNKHEISKKELSSLVAYLKHMEKKDGTNK